VQLLNPALDRPQQSGTVLFQRAAAVDAGSYIWWCCAISVLLLLAVQVGARSVLLEGSMMEDYSQLQPGSVLPPTRRVPSGEASSALQEQTPCCTSSCWVSCSHHWHGWHTTQAPPLLSVQLHGDGSRLHAGQRWLRRGWLLLLPPCRPPVIWCAICHLPLLLLAGELWGECRRSSSGS